MSYRPTPTADEIRTGVMAVQQGLRMLQAIPPEVLDAVRFYYEDDRDRLRPFGYDQALETLHRDVYDLIADREAWKAKGRRTFPRFDAKKVLDDINNPK